MRWGILYLRVISSKAIIAISKVDWKQEQCNVVQQKQRERKLVGSTRGAPGLYCLFQIYNFTKFEAHCCEICRSYVSKSMSAGDSILSKACMDISRQFVEPTECGNGHFLPLAEVRKNKPRIGYRHSRCSRDQKSIVGRKNNIDNWCHSLRALLLFHSFQTCLEKWRSRDNSVTQDWIKFANVRRVFKCCRWCSLVLMEL